MHPRGEIGLPRECREDLQGYQGLNTVRLFTLKKRRIKGDTHLEKNGVISDSTLFFFHSRSCLKSLIWVYLKMWWRWILRVGQRTLLKHLTKSLMVIHRVHGGLVAWIQNYLTRRRQRIGRRVLFWLVYPDQWCPAAICARTSVVCDSMSMTWVKL